MFNSASRYYSIETAIHTSADGRDITYVRRRFLPEGEDQQLLVEVTVVDGDRLDLISARTIGDSEQFWRIADANNTMNPLELTDEPGEILRVTVPQVNA